MTYLNCLKNARMTIVLALGSLLAYLAFVLLYIYNDASREISYEFANIFLLSSDNYEHSASFINFSFGHRDIVELYTNVLMLFMFFGIAEVENLMTKMQLLFVYFFSVFICGVSAFESEILNGMITLNTTEFTGQSFISGASNAHISVALVLFYILLEKKKVLKLAIILYLSIFLISFTVYYFASNAPTSVSPSISTLDSIYLFIFLPENASFLAAIILLFGFGFKNIQIKKEVAVSLTKKYYSKEINIAFFIFIFSLVQLYF